MTNDKNIQTVKSIHAAFAKGDVPNVVEFLDENVLWGTRTPTAEVPWHRSYNGKMNVPSYFKTLGEEVTYSKFEPTEYLGSDTHVSCVVAYEMTVKRTGKIVRGVDTHHFFFKNNRVTQFICDGSDITAQNGWTNGRTVTDNQIVAKNCFECLDTRDVDGLQKLFAPTAKVHGLGTNVLDTKGLCETMTGFFRAFPDSRMPIDSVIANQNEVCIRHRFEGTHKETFMGHTSTNKRVSMTGTMTLRTNIEGQVTECWLNADMLSLYTQIGVVTLPKG